jgi:hypothetical protein
MNLKGTLTEIDCWSFKPALVSLFAVALLELVCGLPGSVSFFLIPLSVLGYGISFVVILVITAYCLLKKRPKRGASALLVFLLPFLLWRPINWAADVAHLGLTVGLGVGQLGAPSKSSDGKFMAYDWSVGLVTNPSTFLIHDATDEVALPMDKHAHSTSSTNDLEEECADNVRHLIGHYYVCNF